MVTVDFCGFRKKSGNKVDQRYGNNVTNNPNIKWCWFSLSLNPNIDWNIISNNPIKIFDIPHLAKPKINDKTPQPYIPFKKNQMNPNKKQGKL